MSPTRARRAHIVVAVLSSAVLLAACAAEGASPPDQLAAAGGNAGQSQSPAASTGPVSVTTDKSAYQPHSPVTITVAVSASGRPAAGVQGSADTFDVALQISHLNSLVVAIPPGSQTMTDPGSLVLTQTTSSQQTFVWTPPATDFQGYFVAATVTDAAGNPIGADATAVDVSSDTNKFPRYGFTSGYGSDVDPNAVAAFLNSYHINNVQFYDWAYRHHLPEDRDPTTGALLPSWVDGAGNTNEQAIVQNLLAAVHADGMDATSYDLVYGADNGFGQDGSGVQSSWGLFNSNDCTSPNFQDGYPPSWPVQFIFLMDPANPDWQTYLLAKQQGLITDYGFDGWHADQLGQRGSLYACSGGAAIDLASNMASMVGAYGKALPNKKLIFNAVSQYGQQQVATSSALSFLYSEVWPGTAPLSTCPNLPQPTPNTQTSYADLKALIDCNSSLGAGKNTVLAAYVNLKQSQAIPQVQPTFNTPDVLMADAVIFASGGAHIELGDLNHMLSQEYYPNKNLTMTADLAQTLGSYYDFLVAYENLLRDGAVTNNNKIDMPGTNTGTDDGAAGTVWAFAKSSGNTDILQFLNLTNSADGTWRGDGSPPMPAPTTLANRTVKYHYPGPAPTAVTFASPDVAQGAPQALTMTTGTDTTGGPYVQFTLPSLTYWDMVWVEFGPSSPHR